MNRKSKFVQSTLKNCIISSVYSLEFLYKYLITYYISRDGYLQIYQRFNAEIKKNAKI